LSFKDISVSQGSIALMLCNVYSSVMLKTRLLTAIFDPVKLNLDKGSFFDVQGIDVIIITHEHYDHFDKKLVMEMQRRSSAAVITTPFVAEGESVTIKDVTFHAEHCEHFANEPLSFIIETDAVSIYHPSDSGPFPGMEEIKSNYEPGMMLYMHTSKEELRKIAELIKPSIVVSYFDPRFANLEIPGAELKMVKQFEIFRYP